MKLLTPIPIIDQLVYRYNIYDHDFFPDCFRAMEEHWDDIPFRNQELVWFKVFNRYPDNKHLWKRRLYRLQNNYRLYDDVVDLEKIEGPDFDHANTHSMVGTLSKHGEEFGKNYLLVVPELGRLYVHNRCLKFFVENQALLNAQSRPGGLDRLIWCIYKRLWNTLGLWFFIRDFDLAVDVEADAALMADLRMVEARKHFLLSGPLMRHRSHTFRNTQKEDKNGVTFGGRSSQFSVTAYDRNVRIANAPPKERKRLVASRNILESKLYRRKPKKHVVRMEAKFTDLMIYPPSDTSERPAIAQANRLPSKHSWNHDRKYRRVYWSQLDLVGLFEETLNGLEILHSNLRPYLTYNKNRNPLSETANHFTVANLRRIRKQAPHQWDTMRHPFHRFLAGAVGKMKNSKLSARP